MKNVFFISRVLLLTPHVLQTYRVEQELPDKTFSTLQEHFL